MISSLRQAPLDFVAELRLRQWGRRNYVPASRRMDTDWHPVVLDEMQRKDAELQGEAPLRTIIGSAGIIPLKPSQHEKIRFDQPHSELAAPRFSQRRPAQVAINDQVALNSVPLRRQEHSG